MARRGECIFVLILVVLWGCSMVDGLGINWGEVSNLPLDPKVVVQMLKDNNITKVKLFEIHDKTLKSLAGSDIEVMVAIPNYLLADMVDPKKATKWVEKNVTAYMGKGGVNIKWVAVGNEPFLTSYNGSFINSTYPALKNVQTALNQAGHGDKVKATVPLNADVFMSPKNKNVPSAGYFRPDIDTQMNDIVTFLDKHKCPFTVNIYPYISLYQDPDFPLDYAFFDGNVSLIMDGEIAYRNSFDAAYDTLVAALDKSGVKDMPIYVGEVGWPTDGDKHANIQLAHKFYSGLMKKITNNEGTPVRPKQYIEVFLFGLLDEDAKSIDPGNFERHWGIFTIDGLPKFPLDLTGKGKNSTLVGAKNVKSLPKKWCVASPKATNVTAMEEASKYAGDYGDLTPLGMGCSCGDLDAKGNASYAFNIYFQNQGQIAGSCGFGGMAMETTTDPSSGNCTFPIRLTRPPSPPPASAPVSQDLESSADDKPGSDSPKKSYAHYHGPPIMLFLAFEVVALFFL